MVLAEHYPAWALVTLASAGNVLGSVVNWYLGRFIARFEGRRWFPVSRQQVAKAEGWYQRWGKWVSILGRFIPSNFLLILRITLPSARRNPHYREARSARSQSRVHQSRT